MLAWQAWHDQNTTLDAWFEEFPLQSTCDPAARNYGVFAREVGRSFGLESAAMIESRTVACATRLCRPALLSPVMAMVLAAGVVSQQREKPVEIALNELFTSCRPERGALETDVVYQTLGDHSSHRCARCGPQRGARASGGLLLRERRRGRLCAPRRAAVRFRERGVGHRARSAAGGEAAPAAAAGTAGPVGARPSAGARRDRADRHRGLRPVAGSPSSRTSSTSSMTRVTRPSCVPCA